MAKRYSKNKKNRQKWVEYLFYGIVIALVVLLIVKAAVPGASVDDTGYMITEEGHVHTADGQHVGTVDEMFGTAEATAQTDGEAGATAEPADEAVAEPTAEPAAE